LAFLTLRVGESNSFPRRSSRCLILLLIAVACFHISLGVIETRALDYPPEEVGGDNVVCKIVSLDYPPAVIGGHSFTVTLVVNYSFPYSYYSYVNSLKVMIYEGKHKDFRKFVTQKSTTVLSSGSLRLSIELNAPLTQEWLLTAYACYHRSFYEPWYYQPARGGYKSFTVSVYTKCRIWLTTSPSEVARYAKMLGGGEYDAGSTATLKVDTTVQGAPGTRYIFVSWTVEGRRYYTEAPTIQVYSREVTATAEFKVQHQLVVKSEFGYPQGSGWYDEGSSAMFSVTSPVGFGIRYTFERWSGDSTSPSPTSTIAMNSPKTVVALWRTDYTAPIVMVLGVVGASAAAIRSLAHYRKRKASGLVPPLAVVARMSVATVSMPIEPVSKAQAAKGVKEVPTREQALTVDDRVYNYIVEHEGTISLSQAAKDLGISPNELNAAIDRLKSQGRLA